MTHTESSASGITGIAIWILRILVAGVFLFAAYMKLSGQQMMIDEFETVGLGQWFRYFTGLLELAGGILVLIPAWSVIGALILLAVDIGAFFAQVLVIKMDFIHTLVIAAVILVLIYLQRGQLRR
jgi:putative oxidoreductase